MADAPYDRPAPKPQRSLADPMPILEGAEPVRVEIDLLKESYDRILELLRQEELDQDEGLRTVLLSGLGYMDASLKLAQINRAVASGDETEAKRIEGLVQDLASYHTMYSVLKYRTFKLYKLSQKLELNVAGLRAAEEMWAEWAERMRAERTQMQAEIIKLRALITEFNIDVELPPSSVRRFEPVETPELQATGEPDALNDTISDIDVVDPPSRLSLWVRIRKFFRS